jgi:hypothetical protein
MLTTIAVLCLSIPLTGAGVTLIVDPCPIAKAVGVSLVTGGLGAFVLCVIQLATG